MSWTAVTGYLGGIKEYWIYRNGVKVGTSATATYNATGLTTATNYTFEVSAVGNDLVEGPKSAALSVRTA